MESQSALLNCEIANLPEVACIDVRPCIALARRRVGDEGGEHGVVFGRDDVTDAEGVDVRFVLFGEGAGRFLANDFGECVAVDVKILLNDDAKLR